MTSAKCFADWIREAGRGHISAFLGWGTMLVYTILSVTRLSFDTDYTYFGTGNTELPWIGAGLDLLWLSWSFSICFSRRNRISITACL